MKKIKIPSFRAKRIANIRIKVKTFRIKGIRK